MSVPHHEYGTASKFSANPRSSMTNSHMEMMSSYGGHMNAGTTSSRMTTAELFSGPNTTAAEFDFRRPTTASKFDFSREMPTTAAEFEFRRPTATASNFDFRGMPTNNTASRSFDPSAGRDMMMSTRSPFPNPVYGKTAAAFGNYWEH